MELVSPRQRTGSRPKDTPTAALRTDAAAVLNNDATASLEMLAVALLVRSANGTR